MALRARLTPPRVVQADWPWHNAKAASLPASMLFAGARRFEAENYLGSGYAARKALEAKPNGWVPLMTVVRPRQPSRLKGILVSPEFGTPFLAATQVFDVRPVPRKWLSLDRTDAASDRFVSPSTILVTRSGSVGRATLAGKAITEFLISDDLLRIEIADPDWWGWVYAYLRSPTARSMMSAAQYGHIIKHLEVFHLEQLPLVRPVRSLRAPFTERARRIVELRDEALDLILEAEVELASRLGSPTGAESMAGFAVRASDLFRLGRRLDALRHNPTARAAEASMQAKALRLEPLATLVDRVFIPGRFKHVYGEEGTPYLDSAQILEVAPDIDKRVLSLGDERKAGYLVERGTLLIPCSGQLHGIIGSVVLAAEWHESKVLTNHILRIVPKAKPPIRIGYLQLVLGHPELGRPRLLKTAFGSSVPELDANEISRLDIPRIEPDIEDRLGSMMEEAAALLSEANAIEELVADEAERLIQTFMAGAPEQFE